MAALAAAASASAITFDFTGGNKTFVDSETFTVGYQSVTVTASETDGTARKVYLGVNGLGVSSGLNPQIDNKWRDDMLSLDFLTNVFIRSFTIRGQDGNDRVWIRLDGGAWTNKMKVANNTEVPVNQNGQKVDFTQGRSRVAQQGYFLASITVSDTGTTFALLGLALLGLGAFRRLKS